ncbi:putative metalloprotease CJM1_0395 family protein [Sulfurimonas sp.]|uniref:putative metalloprotease CJM1_0395 family protein n=1 Tax=Sulfurimonas sp. TaxID=2022749 RepID=UPI0035686CB7
MDIGLSTLYDIGSNYSIKLNDKERLVYEDDPLRKQKTPQEKKLAKEEEKKAVEKSKDTKELSQDEKRLVLDLQSRDAEVRAHESAHQSGGASTGAATYTYQQGPDGKMYAIGGEVSVSFQSGSTPQETIANAQAVIASALAPADPSGQDLAVASSAMVMMMKAQQQVAREAQEAVMGKETYKNEADNNSSISSTDLDIPA